MHVKIITKCRDQMEKETKNDCQLLSIFVMDVDVTVFLFRIRIVFLPLFYMYTLLNITYVHISTWKIH